MNASYTLPPLAAGSNFIIDLCVNPDGRTYTYIHEVLKKVPRVFLRDSPGEVG